MHLNRLQKKEILQIINQRKGETKLGEQVQLLKSKNLNELAVLRDQGAKFCLLGIPENIGVKGNYSSSSTEKSWSCFLKCFLNMQSNRFLSGEEFVVLGEVDVKDLMKKADAMDAQMPYYIQKLHVLCEELDDRVSEVVKAVVEEGLIPVIIGGGHNNSYPILNGVSSALERKRGVNAINMNIHADFRALEGRHSGNGFSYAKHKSYLNKYFAFGLHESYNGENMLRLMDSTRNVKYQMLEDITYLDKHLMQALEYVRDDHVPSGIEIGMSAIRNMPSTQLSPSGFSLEQARHYIRKCCQTLKVAYLHLADASPESTEDVLVGKSLAILVSDFAKNYL